MMFIFILLCIMFVWYVIIDMSISISKDWGFELIGVMIRVIITFLCLLSIYCSIFDKGTILW